MTRARIVELKNGMIAVYLKATSDTDHLQDVPDCTWDRALSAFTLPVSSFHAGQVIDKLQPRGWSVSQNVLDLTQPLPTPERAADIKRQFPHLWDLQVADVDFAYKARFRCIIADDPGLGKTVTTIAAIKMLALKQPPLIVAPGSVIYQWQEELEKWGGLKSCVNTPTSRTDQIFIASWEYMVQWQDMLADYRFPLVVFDEAHRMKNLRAQRTNAARRLGRLAKHLLFLTGTPLINRAEELWPMLNLIDPAGWSSFTTYKQMYCTIDARDWRPESQADLASHMRQAKAQREAELAARLVKVMIRHTKDELRGTGLIPERLPDQKLNVHLSNQAEYDSARADLTRYLINAGQGWRADRAKRAKALVMLNTLRMISGRGKIKSVIEVAADLLDGDDSRKLVVYALHHEVVEALKEGLSKYGALTIYGSTSLLQRRAAQTAFQRESGPRVLVISEAGEEGLNLFRASYLVVAEQPWTPKALDQAAGRIDRGGQTRATSVVRLLAQGTVDQRIDKLIERKRDLIKNVVGDEPPESIVTELLQQMEES